MRMAERLIREAVRRSTGGEGSVTYRGNTQTSGAPSSAEAMIDTATGKRFFMLGVSPLDNTDYILK